MARANHQRDAANERPNQTARRRPARDQNGTGGAPPIAPLAPIPTHSRQRAAVATEPGPDNSSQLAAHPTEQVSADAAGSLSEMALHTEEGVERQEPASSTGRAAPQTTRPRRLAKPTPEAAHQPIIIAGATRSTVAKSARKRAAKRAERAEGGPSSETRAATNAAWRSKIARVAAIVVIAATLFAALAATTPVGSGIGVSAALQAYANAMPWSAPASHSSPARGVSPTQQSIISDIQAVFGPYAPGALNIARCESDYNASAWNPTPILGSHASGVFQILYPSTWNTTSYRGYSPYNSWANVRAAYEIFKRDGYSWHEWACRP